MDEQMIYYWENKIDEIENQELSIDDYILHFTLISQNISSGINKWICCEDMNKLLGFIKFVALPSSQITRALIDKDKKEEVRIDAIGYDKNTSFEEVKLTLDNITQEVDYRDGVILTLELYENIKDVGSKLIREYKEEDLVDVLEDCFNFKIDEIENIFNNLDKNKFMLKRIIPILDNLDMM